MLQCHRSLFDFLKRQAGAICSRPAIRSRSLFLLLMLLVSAAHAVPDTERATLQAIYSQTNGANWGTTTNWNGASGTECTWFGITCDSTQSHVISIDLHDNRLTGTLPPLDSLTALQDLLLYSTQGTFGCDSEFFGNYCNNITGSIPALSNLTALQKVDVNNNSFSGPIPSLTGLASLSSLDVSTNQLTGSLPNLNGLSSLLIFSAEHNQLTGSIPLLTSLPQLLTFDVCTNQLTGPLPSLTGLSVLRGFYACNNNLTGSIPSLDGLGRIYLFQYDVSSNQLTGAIPILIGVTNLANFWVDNNRLSGPIPALPPSLGIFFAFNNQLSGAIPSLSGMSSLTNFEVQNNQLTGSIPSLDGLSALSDLNVSNNQLSGSLPDFAGATSLEQFYAENNRLTGVIPPLNKYALAFFDVANNQFTGSIPDLTTLTALRVFNVSFNQLTGAVPDAISTPNYAVGASSLCPNLLTPSSSPGWDQATRVSPWYRDCVANPANLDQVGLTGTWYNPGTSGQGLSLQILPDVLDAGKGFLSSGWLTFSAETPPFGQRWYTLQGAVDSSKPSATIDIATSASDGNFNSAPRVVATRVGVAAIEFSDCTHGTLEYSFFDSAYDNGTIPLTRLTANTNCTLPGSNGIAGSTSLLSGNWYDPATSGQGIVFDVAPSQNALFATWYTFASSAAQSSNPTFRNQRWYTLQSGAFTAGSTSLSDIPILYTTDGVFDGPSLTTIMQVGSADIAFQSCTAMTLQYRFTSGENNGLNGLINLIRLGPVPAGCSF